MLLATITERATLQQTFNAAQQKISLKHFDFWKIFIKKLNLKRMKTSLFA